MTSRFHCFHSNLESLITRFKLLRKYALLEGWMYVRLHVRTLERAYLSSNSNQVINDSIFDRKHWQRDVTSLMDGPWMQFQSQSFHMRQLRIVASRFVMNGIGNCFLQRWKLWFRNCTTKNSLNSRSTYNLANYPPRTQFAWPTFLDDGTHSDAWCQDTSNVRRKFCFHFSSEQTWKISNFQNEPPILSM